MKAVVLLQFGVSLAKFRQYLPSLHISKKKKKKKKEAISLHNSAGVCNTSG